MSETNCSTCPYWSRHSDQSEHGACVRYPPVPVVVRPDTADQYPYVATHWPETSATDGCGEHPDIQAAMQPARPMTHAEMLLAKCKAAEAKAAQGVE